MNRQILLPLPSEMRLPSRLAGNAVSVAKAFGATLYGMQLHPLEEFTSAGHRNQTANLALIRGLAFNAGLEFRTDSMSRFSREFGEELGQEARYNDLTLVLWAGNSETTLSLAKAIILHSGRPVMLLPENPVELDTESIVIAWDGGRAAARAVADAMPFLAQAKRTTIVTVSDERPAPAAEVAERLSTYLKAKNVHNEIRHCVSAGRPVAEVLQDETQSLGSGVLVMGAYAHHPIKDVLLGGATRGVLADLRSPTLLSR